MARSVESDMGCILDSSALAQCLACTQTLIENNHLVLWCCLFLKFYLVVCLSIYCLEECSFFMSVPWKLQIVVWPLNFLQLKTLDTFGDCQRPVFSLGVSQLMHKITNL